MKTTSLRCLAFALLWALPAAAPTTCAASDFLEAISLRDPMFAELDLAAGNSWVEAISADGRHVVFVSTAPNLTTERVSTDVLNVYVRDRLTGTTRLVSVNRLGGAGGNGHSTGARITADGRHVAFESEADDLVWGDANGVRDVFLRDLIGERTELISRNAEGTGSGNRASWWPVITPDGARIAFVSAASDLVPGNDNGIQDVFVRDVAAGETFPVSVGAHMPVPSRWLGSEAPVISDNGRYVAFASRAEGLVPGVRSMVPTLYLRDLESATTIWLGMNIQALTGATDVRCYNPALSEDGEWVAFKLESSPGRLLRHHVSSGTTAVIAPDAYVNGWTYEDASGPVMTPDGRFVVYTSRVHGLEPTQIRRWDVVTGQTQLVSVNRDGTTGGNGISDTPRVSADGRFVWFLSHATNLIAAETDPSSKLFVRDMDLETTTLLNVDPDGIPGSQDVVWPVISSDGTQFAFDSWDDRYVTGDHNRAFDVFASGFDDFDLERVSRALPNSSGLTGLGPSDLAPHSVSADGRYVVFTSFAEDLVPNDGNWTGDVFVRDLGQGKTRLVSVNLEGRGGNGFSRAPSISADGRFMAFESSASDLVDDDDNGQPDIFVRDLVQGVTDLASTHLSGTGSAARGAKRPIISANGRHVAFLSSSSELTGTRPTFRDGVFVRNLDTQEIQLAGSDHPDFGAWQYCEEIVLAADGKSVLFRGVWGSFQPMYRTDLERGVTERVDVPREGTTDSPNSRSGGAALSADGTKAVFLSNHRTLVDEVWKGWTDVYLRDFKTRTTRLISKSLNGGTGNSDALEAAISADGRWIAFVSAANDLVPNDVQRLSPGPQGAMHPFERDVFLHEVETGTTTLISHNARLDRSANGPSDQITLSADGRFLAFRSIASDLVPGPDNDRKDIFVHDRSTGLNTLVSLGSNAHEPGNRASHRPVLAADGATLIFKSYADNLVPLDWNGTADLFWTRPDQPGPINSFSLNIQALSDGRLLIQWRGTEPARYQLEFRDSLTAGDWQSLQATMAVPAVGWIQAQSPAPPGPTERYYRARWE